MPDIMMSIIEDIDSLSDDSFIRKILSKLTEEELIYYIEKIKNIKKNRLYKSDIHGLYHSQKVALFAYLIALDLQLDEVDMQIIMDAALYHDIGRENDFEDSFHGYSSANMIYEVVDNEIYKDETNLKILEAIIDYHSTKDERIRLIFENHEINEQEYERYVKLAKILKDADELDRKRFAEKCNAIVNPEFLRFEKTKELIIFSEEINRLYYLYMEQKNTSIDELTYITSDCLHSIGFDYFRISSILDNGILSFRKMKDTGIRFPKNFDGGNGERWISVVPTDMIDKKGEAFKNFIKGGITFLSQNQKLYNPLAYNRKFEAIQKGLPYDKSGYIDEMYAFLEIPTQDIVALFVTKEYANKDVNEVEYLYNSLDFDTLKNKISYIFENINYNDIENNDELCQLLNEYKSEIDRYMQLSIGEKTELEREMPKILNRILVKINKIVGNLIHEYYLIKLGKTAGSKVSIMEVVNYELAKNMIEANLVIGDEEIIYVIGQKRKEDKKLTYKNK